MKEKMSNIFDVRKYLAQLTSVQKALLNEVINIMKLVMVMPATNSSSEQSFSAMHRVKSYLRSTMTQERLNHVMILNVHKELADAIDLTDIAKEFASANESRQQTFGHFN